MEKNPITLQEELAALNEAQSINDIVLDPNTGELMVMRPGESRSPDQTVVTDVVTDGFALNLIS